MDVSFRKLFEEKMENLKKSIKKPNILILGETGAGKSSLINKVFGKDITKVGVGKPVTQFTTSYEIDDIPIVLFDTKGYEVGTNQHQEYVGDIASYAKNDANLPADEQIHMIWYCISATSHRLTDIDLKLLKSFKNTKKPISVVLTKCDLTTTEELAALNNIVKQEVGINVFFVSTKMKNDEMDLQILIEWAVENLPNALQNTLIRSQKVNLDIKRKRANNIILQHSSNSAFVGFIPIPFSDAPVLLANQAGMVARVLYLYDMEFLENKLTSIIGKLGFGKIISQAGIWLSSQIMRLIPYIGTIVGGIINGTVASAITASMGYTISTVCYQISYHVIENEEGKLTELLNNLETNFHTIFKDQFNSEIKRTKGAT